MTYPQWFLDSLQKAIQNGRGKVYKEVYEKLDTKEVEKDIYIELLE